MESASFSARQKRVLTACFIAYACAYVGRLNMSATLNRIMEELAISAAQGGALQTVFALVYACGQLGFGALADRMNPRCMIAAGLTGSALANICFSLGHSFMLMLILWAVNGLFQSMLWTSIVRLLAENFSAAKRPRATFIMSYSLALGHLAAWGLSAQLYAAYGWRKAYLVPGGVLVIACVLFCAILPRGRMEGESLPETVPAAKKLPVSALAGTGLGVILVLCALNGFVRDGVITWAPTILGAEEGAFTLIIPAINLLGITFGAISVRKGGRSVRLMVGLMMLLCALPAAGLLVFPAGIMAVPALLLGLMSAVLYGSNPLLTTLVPLQYHGCGRVGLAAGLIDSSIYLGSALAGMLTGWIRESSGGWTAVFALWAACSFLGAITARSSVKGEKKLP